MYICLGEEASLRGSFGLLVGEQLSRECTVILACCVSPFFCLNVHFLFFSRIPLCRAVPPHLLPLKLVETKLVAHCPAICLLTHSLVVIIQRVAQPVTFTTQEIWLYYQHGDEQAGEDRVSRIQSVAM